MSHKTLLLACASLALCLFSFLPGAVTAHSDANTEANKLLQQAEELTNIRSSGGHSFHLTARVQLSVVKGQVQEGTYSLLWESPTVWRDETNFQDFSQMRIAKEDKLYIVRKPWNLTLEVFRLLKLLDFPSLLRITPEVKAQRLQEKTRNGSRERTVEIAFPSKPAYKTIVLDSVSPIPTRIEYKGAHSGFQFKDYAEFHGHQFPRSLIEFDSNKPLIQVLVQGIEDATLDASSFFPPPDAPWMYWCREPEVARSLEPEGKVHPIPWPLRSGALQRPMAIYGIIGVDGQWHNLAVVKSADREVDSYWMNEMRQQHFSPAKCGDRPVLQESVVEFRLP